MAKRFPILLILTICWLALSLTGCGGASEPFTASGRITQASDPDLGVQYVTLFFLPGTTKTQTVGDGTWSAEVTGTVKVIPAGLGWTFMPQSREVTASAAIADFAATPNTATATAVAAGGWHTLALMSDGKVFSWGNDTYGQLGVDSVAHRVDAPVQVAGLTDPLAVGAGGVHAVALVDDVNHLLMAWGYGLNGELGNNTNMHSSLPVAVSNLTGVTAIAVGWSHTLALMSDGTVQAWGRNNYGQLGNGTTTNARVPVQVSDLTGITITAIAAGGYHSLALADDGTVYAWGNNTYGQLGDGYNVKQTTPVAVSMPLGVTVTAIAAGAYHSVALCDDGSVYVWGRNNHGQLGDGSTTNRNTPNELTTVSNVKAIAAGGYHTLALEGTLADKSVLVWGSDAYGQLGDGLAADRLSPYTLSGFTCTAVSAGFWHSAALKSDGNVYTWGRNNYGQLGDGTTTDRLTPTALTP